LRTECDDANSLQELLDQRHRGAARLLIAIISTQRKHNDLPVNTVALANKIARIAWSVLAHGRTFEASKIEAA
jgi:hypothetical protein